MKIELTEAPADMALAGTGPELWVRVMSEDVLQLREVIAALDEEQRNTFHRYQHTPARYFPALGIAHGDDHDFANEEWFVFKQIGSK